MRAPVGSGKKRRIWEGHRHKIQISEIKKVLEGLGNCKKERARWAKVSRLPLRNLSVKRFYTRLSAWREVTTAGTGLVLKGVLHPRS